MQENEYETAPSRHSTLTYLVSRPRAASYARVQVRIPIRLRDLRLLFVLYSVAVVEFNKTRALFISYAGTCIIPARIYVPNTHITTYGMYTYTYDSISVRPPHDDDDDRRAFDCLIKARAKERNKDRDDDKITVTITIIKNIKRKKSTTTQKKRARGNGGEHEKSAWWSWWSGCRGGRGGRDGRAVNGSCARTNVNRRCDDETAGGAPLWRCER